jgi:pilus assembly protein CpaB
VRRRVLAGALAVLLAAVGAVLLLSYVGTADERAMAGLDTVSVLVVTKAVPAGTPGTDITSSVTAKTLPAVAVAPGTVADLGQLRGKVATAELLPGEQLLTSRFAVPQKPQSDQVTIPKGMQELSVALDAQRVLGGHLVTGARVGVFVSLPKDGVDPAKTRLLLQKVLVSRVDGGVPAAAGSTPSAAASGSLGSPGTAASATTSGQVTVTFVLTADDAEKVVFGAENGTIWLSLQPTAAVPDTGGVTSEGLDP